MLTERTEHLDAIRVALAETRLKPFVLHGRMSRKQRAALVTALNALPPDAPRVMLSTGKLVGEGFDHPPLDTRQGVWPAAGARKLMPIKVAAPCQVWWAIGNTRLRHTRALQLI